MWKRKSPTVGVRVAWVGLNRCVHQSTAEKGTRLRRFRSTCRRFCTFENLRSSSWCVAPRRASPARSRVWKQFRMHVLQSLVEFLCLARLWAFMAFDFFRFEWQARWWQKWILRFLAWFLLSRSSPLSLLCCLSLFSRSRFSTFVCFTLVCLVS